MVTLLIALLLYFAILTDSSFNDKNIEMISSVIQYLRVEQYILVTKSFKVSSIIPKLKALSKRNFSGVYLSFVDLINYMEVDQFPERRSMIIIKVEDNMELEAIMESLKIKVSDKKIFVSFLWMMLLPKNHTKFTKNNFHVPFDCRFFLARETEISEIYQIKKKSDFISVYFGKYTNGRLLTNTTYAYEKKMNMRGEKMIMQRPDWVKCLYPADCLHTEIWEDMGRLLNYTTEFVKTSELKKNPAILPDTITDLKLLHYLIKENENVVGPLTEGVAHLYIREISQNEERWDSYIRPFSPKLWMAILSWIIVSSTVIFIATWIALYLLSLKGFTLLDEALIPLSAFCNQASSYIPTISSSRIARISSYIASVVIVPAYSASLISYLTIHYPKIPFNDLASFAQDGSYKLAPLYVPLPIFYFMQGDDPLAIKIREKQLLVPLSDFPRSHGDAIKKICTEDKITILNYNFRMFHYPSPCSIMRVSGVIFENFQGLELFNEGTHYRELLLKLVIRFRSSGILEKMQKINYGKTSIEKIQEFNEIGMSETKTIFVFCLLSNFTSILLFIGEYLYYHVKSRYRRKSIKPKKKNTPLVRSTQVLRRISWHHLNCKTQQHFKKSNFALMLDEYSTYY